MVSEHWNSLFDQNLNCMTKTRKLRFMGSAFNSTKYEFKICWNMHNICNTGPERWGGGALPGSGAVFPGFGSVFPGSGSGFGSVFIMKIWLKWLPHKLKILLKYLFFIRIILEQVLKSEVEPSPFSGISGQLFLSIKGFS